MSDYDARPIYMDAIQQKLDEEHRKYRKAYNRLYDLSASGRDEEAERRLVPVRRRWEAAKAAYVAARAANPVPDWAKAGKP